MESGLAQERRVSGWDDSWDMVVAMSLAVIWDSLDVMLVGKK